MPRLTIKGAIPYRLKYERTLNLDTTRTSLEKNKQLNNKKIQIFRSEITLFNY